MRLCSCHVSGLPVVDRTGRLVGLLTENDLVLGGGTLLPLHLQLLDDLISQGAPARSLQDLQRLARLPVQDLMTREVMAAQPKTPIGELISMLVTNDFKRIPVIDGTSLVGIVTRADIIKVIK